MLRVQIQRQETISKMPRVQINLAQHTYEDRSSAVSVQRLVNLYMEPKPPESKVQWALHGTPGLRLWTTSSGIAGCRGMCVMGDYLFAVMGSSLYAYDSTKVETYIGAISGIELVGMATNGTQVVIVSDIEIYIATLTSLVTATVSNALGVAFQDGYMLFAERNSQKLFISGLQDATAYDPTEFTLVNAEPDNNAGIANVLRETVVFGKRSAQIYYNSGQADFPFTRTQSGVIPRGTISPRSVASYQGTVMWLGDDLRVYAIRNSGIEAISTPALDVSIAACTGHSGAHAFIYSQEGHIFYCLTLNEATFCFDATTDRWHERESYGLNYWRARCHAFYMQSNLVGDAFNGNIYELDLDYYTDNGEAIRREVVAPAIHAAEKRAQIHEVELTAEVGVGLIAGQGSNPIVMLDWSDDGGRTWSNQHDAKLGPIGEYKQRVKWTRLGQFRSRSIRFAISDPVKVAFLTAFIEVEGADL